MPLTPPVLFFMPPTFLIIMLITGIITIVMPT
jgi:hypothetical protein